MDSTAENEYALFLEKVKRTVYIDSLSPHVTESVLRSAFNQFGMVKSVRFIPHYLESKSSAQCALVEMKEAKQAVAVVRDLAQFPFMVSGMPRPVGAVTAEVEMFDDRPVKPGRRIQCQWLDPSDPDFEVAEKLKRLTSKHAAEASFLLRKHMEREVQLHNQQLENLRANQTKYNLIESIMIDRTARRLAQRYDMNIADN